MILEVCITIGICIAPPAEPPPPPEQVLISAAEKATARDLWLEVGRARLVVAWADSLQPESDRQAPTPVEATGGRRPPPDSSAPVAGTNCGGDLPTCSIMQCESGGNIRAENPTSSASGKWQITSGTWGGYAGYPTAASAPEEVQDERARQLWNGGQGASHWSQCL